MYILANEKRLTISKEPGVQRNKITGQLILTLTTEKQNATASEIEDLINYIAENGPTIVVYDDEDNPIASLAGFKLYPSFALTKLGFWEIVIENESENTYQIERANEKIRSLEATIESQAQTIAGQTEVINAQGIEIYNQEQRISDQDLLIDNQTIRISEQNATIISQGERITAQAEQIEAQNEEISLLNDTLLEILMG